MVGHFFSLTKDDIKKYSEFVGNSLTVYWENTHDQYDRNVPPWACEIGSKPQDVGTEKIFNAECTRFISGDEFNSGEHVRITKESKASCTLKKLTSIPCRPDSEKNILRRNIILLNFKNTNIVHTHSIKNMLKKLKGAGVN